MNFRFLKIKKFKENLLFKSSLSISIYILVVSFKSNAEVDFSIPKNDYLKQFGSEFVSEICSEDQFLQCFRVSNFNCRETAKTEYNECVKALKFPEKFEYSDFDSNYEKNLGECVGSRLAKKYRINFKNIDVCRKRVIF